MAIAGAPIILSLMHGPADGGGITSDSHGLDAIKSHLARSDVLILELMRQLQLIEHLEFAALILDSLQAWSAIAGL